MAVQAQSRLEAQRVARAQAGRRHLGLLEQEAGQRRRIGGRDRDLEPVLAGVAAARDPAGSPADRGRHGVHEGEPARARAQPAEHLCRARPLQREQGAVSQLLDRVLRLERLAQVGEVGGAAPGIGDHEQTLGHAAGDQVVERAAPIVGEYGVAQAALGEARDVARHQALESLGRAGTVDQRLGHVRDVEQRRGGAAVPVLGHDAGRVLHRQRPAGEVDELAAKLHVQVVQRRAARGGGGWRDSRIAQGRDSARGMAGRPTAAAKPPLSRT